MSKVETKAQPDGSLLPGALHEGRCRHAVLGLLDRWYDEGANYFHVRLDDGSRALVRLDLESGEWTVVKRTWLDA